MEFGGAKVQLALRVKDSLKRAFELRLAGDYEQAQAEIKDAFAQFVAHEQPEVRKAYAESMEYRAKVLEKLGDYVRHNFEGNLNPGWNSARRSTGGACMLRAWCGGRPAARESWRMLS